MKKLLIANRGEIACRIHRTAQRMGIATVALYNPHDTGALHTQTCDQAVLLPGDSLAETYLNAAAILEAARNTGADAIHPGYGFLSEDPDFAQAVQDAGLIWVGPGADAIRAMGLKDQAKQLMEQAGVPVVPGYNGADQAADVLAQAADDIGYPVLIKAVAGGGGKGMRLVEAAADFADALASAKSEALNTFGNDRVLIEKFISSPRHIEVQVFGDGADAIHLYERDCSLQRRHQKVIEEAPAPGVSDAVRTAMGDAAVRAAKAIGYSGAGTIEFIVNAAGDIGVDDFYFMEMNTRLQVEHPVTEEILGLDLVEWQLTVARGQGLPMTQADIKPQAVSVEARLYAEDPFNGFWPSVGDLHVLQFGPDMRVDTGVAQGGSVTPHFDPMIAKVIATAPTRAEALHKLSRGLQASDIAGVVTNRDLLVRLLNNDDFAQGHFDTGLIERQSGQLLCPPTPSDAAVALAMATALCPNGPGALAGFTLGGSLKWQQKLKYRDAMYVAEFQVSGVDAQVHMDGRVVELAWQPHGWAVVSGAKATAYVHDACVTVCADETFVFDLVDPLDVSVQSNASGVVQAPMPGVIVWVAPELEAFDKPIDIEQGFAMFTMESMKMQHTVKAPLDGTLMAVNIKTGDQVAPGDVLCEIAGAS